MPTPYFAYSTTKTPFQSYQRQFQTTPFGAKPIVTSPWQNPIANAMGTNRSPTKPVAAAPAAKKLTDEEKRENSLQAQRDSAARARDRLGVRDTGNAGGGVENLVVANRRASRQLLG